MVRRKLVNLTQLDDEKTNQNFDKVIQELNDFQDIEITTPSGANTDFTVSHDLKRVVTGFIVLKQDRAGSIYWNPYYTTQTKFIVLRASVASMQIRLRLQ